MRRRFKRFVEGSLLSVAICCISMGCSSKKWQNADGAAWATTFHIVYFAEEDLQDSIQSVINDVNNSLSPFNESSTVSRINSNRDLHVDGMVAKVFDVSKWVNELSDKAFDPTVAPAVNMWGFGYKDEKEPDSEMIDSVRRLVGIDECRIEGGKLLKKRDKTEFNFSGIAKGYGCDLIAEMFKRNDIQDFMVEIGGEIALAGKNSKDENWRIMIVTPEEGVEGYGDIFIQLTDCGIATSGNYRNFRETEKGRIGHTIDPKTCLPVSTSVFSATVVAPTTIVADAFATACMVMKPEASLKMIEGVENVELMLIVERHDGRYELKMTKGFKRYLYENQGV